jgi:hypothetical protein
MCRSSRDRAFVDNVGMEFLSRSLPAEREGLHISHSVVRDSYRRALSQCAKRSIHRTDHSEIDLPRSSIDLPCPNRDAVLRWKSCMHCNGTLRRIPELSSFLLLTLFLADWCLLAQWAGQSSRQGSPVAGGSMSRPPPTSPAPLPVGELGWSSGWLLRSSPKARYAWPGRDSASCASRHPPHDFHFSSVDEFAEKVSLFVKEGRSIFSAARTVDEQLPTHSEDWAGAPRCCWTSRAPCR